MAKWVDMVEDGAVIYSAILFGSFVLSVHHYMSLDEEHWVLSCEGLFDNVSLASKKLKAAKCQAIAKLQIVLQEAYAETLKDYK